MYFGTQLSDVLWYTVIRGTLVHSYQRYSGTQLSDILWYTVIRRTLVAWSPIKHIALRDGHHRLNSDIQFARVDFGAKTRCGDLIFLMCTTYPNNEIVCRVLPSP